MFYSFVFNLKKRPLLLSLFDLAASIACKSLVKHANVSLSHHTVSLMMITSDLSASWCRLMICSVKSPSGSGVNTEWLIKLYSWCRGVSLCLFSRLPLCCYFIWCLWIYDCEEPDKTSVMDVCVTVTCTYCSSTAPHYQSQW